MGDKKSRWIDLRSAGAQSLLSFRRQDRTFGDKKKERFIKVAGFIRRVRCKCQFDEEAEEEDQLQIVTQSTSTNNERRQGGAGLLAIGGQEVMRRQLEGCLGIVSERNGVVNRLKRNRPDQIPEVQNTMFTGVPLLRASEEARSAA